MSTTTPKTNRLFVLPVQNLIPDPDVQLDFTYREGWTAQIASKWNSNAIGILTVTDGDVPTNYYVIDGRHRLMAAILRGEPTSLVCEYIPGPLSPEQKAEIKLARDRDRRKVSTVESFIEGTIARDPMAVAIKNIVEGAGFEVGKVRNGQPYDRIEAVKTLEHIYSRNPEYLTRTMELAKLWKGQIKTNQFYWLKGLGQFVFHDYDKKLTESGIERLKAQVPSILVTNSMAQTVGARHSQETANLIAEKLRSIARIKKEEKSAPSPSETS